MKRLLFSCLILGLSACSFAPLSIGVGDFNVPLPGNSSFLGICYTRVGEGIDTNFKSVTYEGDALFTPGQNIGVTEVEINIYGRATDPDPSSTNQVKCVTTISDPDILLSDADEPIVLQAGEPKRISAGGQELANLVVRDEYWLGAAAVDDGVVSLSGELDFSEGRVKAFF